jgi:hypothetical protein
MTTFEYFSVLISVIVGLGITHLLSGVTRVISHPDRFKLYWIHLVWTGWIFLFLVFFWWTTFRFSPVEEWSYKLYTFLILYAVTLYVICAVLMPSEPPDSGDFRRYYFARKRWFFGLLIANTIFGTIDKAIIVGSLGSVEPLWTVAMLALVVPGLVTENEKYHGVIALFYLVTSFVLTIIGGQMG